MTYSSALYAGPGDTLEQAQDNKLRRILELLDAPAEADVLEIGCGWGTLAARLGKAGARVKGITLSSEQRAYAAQMAEREHLQDRLRFELQDYLVDLYKSLKNDLPAFNGDPSWTLPMPARYVIAPDGTIVYAEVNPDYTRRPDPSEMLPAIRKAAA